MVPAAQRWTQVITVQDLWSHTASWIWVASQQYWRNQATIGSTPANHLKGAMFAFLCFPKSAETLVIWGGKTNRHLIAYSRSNVSAKNYQHQLMCIRVIVCSISVEQRHDGREQFASDPTASRLRFEPRPFCAWVQHANHDSFITPSSLASFKSGLVLPFWYRHYPVCPGKEAVKWVCVFYCLTTSPEPLDTMCNFPLLHHHAVSDSSLIQFQTVQ